MVGGYFNWLRTILKVYCENVRRFMGIYSCDYVTDPMFDVRTWFDSGDFSVATDSALRNMNCDIAPDLGRLALEPPDRPQESNMGGAAGMLCWQERNLSPCRWVYLRS